MSKERQAKIRAALANWIELNKRIGEFDEADVRYALELEESRGEFRRATVVGRLKQRLRGILIEQMREQVQ